MEIEESNRVVLVSVLISLIVVLGSLGAIYLRNGGFGGLEGDSEHKTFESERFGFSLSYPSDWILENSSGDGFMEISLLENTGSDRIRATGNGYVGELGYPSLEEFEERINQDLENDENLEKVGEIRNVTKRGESGKEVTFRSFGDNVIYGRIRLIKVENVDYIMNLYVLEEFFDDFESDIDLIMETFGPN
ncbi:MAG: PsbP-related protein [Candidatus Hadarchaeota archaeon]